MLFKANLIFLNNNNDNNDNYNYCCYYYIIILYLPHSPPLWGFSDNISSMRHCVLSPDETLRRELKMRRAAGFFDELRRTLCRMFDINFQTK